MSNIHHFPLCDAMQRRERCNEMLSAIKNEALRELTVMGAGTANMCERVAHIIRIRSAMYGNVHNETVMRQIERAHQSLVAGYPKRSALRIARLGRTLMHGMHLSTIIAQEAA